MVPGAGRLTGVGSREGFESLSAEHKRPLYAFGAVTALCTFLLLSAIVRGDALSVAFHSPVPISAQADVAPAATAAAAPVTAVPSSAVELPTELTPQPISREAARKSATAGFSDTRGTSAGDAGDLSSTTLLETEVPEASTSGRSQEKAQHKVEQAATKATRKAEQAAAKAQRAADRAAAKVQREADRAAAKVQREAEKAAAKAQRATEKAAAKAQRATERAEEKAQRAAEKALSLPEQAASPAQGHPGLGAGKAAEHSHKH